MSDFQWKDRWGNPGSVNVFPDGVLLTLEMNDRAESIEHNLSLEVVRDLHAALGRALTAMTPQLEKGFLVTVDAYGNVSSRQLTLADTAHVGNLVRQSNKPNHNQSAVCSKKPNEK